MARNAKSRPTPGREVSGVTSDNGSRYIVEQAEHCGQYVAALAEMLAEEGRACESGRIVKCALLLNELAGIMEPLVAGLFVKEAAR